MVTISIIPIGLVVFETGIDLNWIFYSGAIVTIPCFPAVILSIIWVKATGKGLISGNITYLHTNLMYLVYFFYRFCPQRLTHKDCYVVEIVQTHYHVAKCVYLN